MLTAHFLSFISPSTDIRQHMVAASLPSTPDAISAYKQMVRYATPPRCSLDDETCLLPLMTSSQPQRLQMIAKYEAQQKENVFIRSTSRRGSAEFRSLDVAAMGAYRQVTRTRTNAHAPHTCTRIPASSVVLTSRDRW
jgi:hypothetical protein